MAFLYNFLTKIQDSVHKYVIHHHRKRSLKTFLSTELQNIPGVGVKTERKLLKFYKSLKVIRGLNYSKIQLIIRFNN